MLYFTQSHLLRDVAYYVGLNTIYEVGILG